MIRGRRPHIGRCRIYSVRFKRTIRISARESWAGDRWTRKRYRFDPRGCHPHHSPPGRVSDPPAFCGPHWPLDLTDQHRENRLRFSLCPQAIHRDENLGRPSTRSLMRSKKLSGSRSRTVESSESILAETLPPQTHGIDTAALVARRTTGTISSEFAGLIIIALIPWARRFLYLRCEGLDDYWSRITNRVKSVLLGVPFYMSTSRAGTAVIFTCVKVKHMRTSLTNCGPDIFFLNIHVEGIQQESYVRTVYPAH